MFEITKNEIMTLFVPQQWLHKVIHLAIDDIHQSQSQHGLRQDVYTHRFVGFSEK